MNTAQAVRSPHPLPAWQTPAVPTAIAVGALVGLVYTLSPLTVWFAVAATLIVRIATRGLPPREARLVGGLLVAAIVVRVLIIAALFQFGTPDHMWFNTFFGDEQYLLVRSLRLRHFWIGSPLSLEAFLDLFESYGWTSYLNVIAFVQMLVGPAPYGIHLLNAAFYLLATVVLHRVVRTSFGPVPAAATLLGTLFFPTLLIWSVSGLKESLNVLVVTCVIAATIAVFRADWRWRAPAALAVVAGLAVLRTLRAGAFEITVIGVAVGLVAGFITRRVWRIAVVVVAVAVLVVPVARSGRVQEAALRLLRPAARMHMGHVFTRGHSYKLLDQGVYDTRRTDAMDWSEGVRFVERAAVSVVLYPTPWDAQSQAELAYLPEQMLWYVILVTAAIGVVAGLRRDALVTSVFASYAATALMVVALNTGNVGTLVRHRSFALPFLIALGAVGVAALIGRLATPSSAARS